MSKKPLPPRQSKQCPLAAKFFPLQTTAMEDKTTSQPPYTSKAKVFSEILKAKEIDFLDFGCSKGGSLAFAQKRFNGRRGLGIDIDDSKVEQTRSAGYDAINFDINDIPNEKLVRFVIMSHFLEHVPSQHAVKNFVRKACTISRDFVYIQQPYFDSDPYLFERRLKLFWSDWTGHPNRMTSLELWLIFRDLELEGLPIKYSLHAYKPITSSLDPSIHPIASPRDQHDYLAGTHPPKASVDFEGNVFSELIGLITFPGCDHSELLRKLRYHRTIISADSDSGPIQQPSLPSPPGVLRDPALLSPKPVRSAAS